MTLLGKIAQIWDGVEHPFLIQDGAELGLSQVVSQAVPELSSIRRGDVVAIIGDFNAPSIAMLLHLADRGAIIVPLTIDSVTQHEYFFESAHVNVVINNGSMYRRVQRGVNRSIEDLRGRGHAGLVLFSTGTTGKPKAILHDLTLFVKRFEVRRQSLRTVSFLAFDHIAGVNTLLHTLFHRGVAIVPNTRTVESVLDACSRYEADALPTTPTFLRLMLMSGAVPKSVPRSLKIISYGTERMDQSTLDALCELLPTVEFRQMFGTSELGVVPVKSETRNSLFMKVVGEGVETRIVDGVLHVRSVNRMVGYLDAPSPFDAEGWYDTKDIVEQKNEYFKVVGRVDDVINVGGLKFMASDVESVALEFPEVSLVKAFPGQNPITGQHVELVVEPKTEGLVDKSALSSFLKARLQPHMVPSRISVGRVKIGHRFKLDGSV